MLEQIVLGAIQGIAEWLPVSSEGLIVLARTNLFPLEQTVADTIREALFLHLGTFFAALVYFRSDVADLFRALLNVKEAERPMRRLLTFLFIATAITGFLGFVIVESEGHALSETIGSSAALINAAIGLLLLVTGGLMLFAKKRRTLERETKDLNGGDSITLGIVQAFAAVPGLSRSGLTVSALLLRGIKEEDALRISFLMSLPVVFIANIVLNLPLLLSMTVAHVAGLGASFLFGLATIHALLKLARRINFGTFVIFFGFLLLVAATF